MARQRLVLKDPGRFSDPANLTWERYVALQARERERYLAERATISPEALSYRTVSPQYLENGRSTSSPTTTIPSCRPPTTSRPPRPTRRSTS